MSSLKELIAELCPAGVEVKSLGECLLRNTGGGTPSRARAEYWDGPIPWASVGDVTASSLVLAKTRQTITVAGLDASSSHLIPAGHVVVAVKIAPGAMRVVERDVAINQDLRGLLLRDDVDPYFLTYYFKTLRVVGNGTIVKGITNATLEGIRVPVPPLEVQREIVRILDTFTKLQAELEAELGARTRQYEHYRREIVEPSQQGQRIALREMESRGIVKLGRGNVISRIDLESCPGAYPVYSSSGAGIGEFGRYGLYMFDDERITWSVDGGGRFFYRRPHRFSVTNVCGWMTIDPSVLRVKYLYYVLTVQWERQSFDYTRKAHPSVIRDTYEIAIPSLEEQDAVVEKLDAFDALVNDLSVGLPAELIARRRQYEYYRDKLMTFEEAAA